MKGLKNKIYFKGDRLQLPWEGWEGVEISPEGVHTPRGTLSPADIDLLFWKAAFYERGTARMSEEERLISRLRERLTND